MTIHGSVDQQKSLLHDKELQYETHPKCEPGNMAVEPGVAALCNPLGLTVK